MLADIGVIVQPPDESRLVPDGAKAATACPEDFRADIGLKMNKKCVAKWKLEMRKRWD